MPIKKIAAILLFTVVYLASASTKASIFYTGNELLESCEGRMDDSQILCFAYIAGVSDSLYYRIAGDRSCVPAGSNLRQLSRVFVSWAAENVQYLHHHANVVVTNALVDTYKCGTMYGYDLDG